MGHVTEFAGKNFQSFIRIDIAPGAIFHTLGDRPREKAVKVLKNLGIHEDYFEDALRGRPYGAKVIDLDEYRWMRKFDEL